MHSDQSAWDERYARGERPGPDAPSPFLVKNIRLLPIGRALDLATGLGFNAIYLAEKGFRVDAVDVSWVALREVSQRTMQKKVTVHFIQADLRQFPIAPGRYELITNFYFLQRDLIPQIRTGLKNGGMVVFETYIIDQRSFGPPHNPDHLLEHNELLSLFRGLRILVYREGVFRIWGRRKAIASLVAQKCLE